MLRELITSCFVFLTIQLEVFVHAPLCEVGDGVQMMKATLLSLQSASMAVQSEYLKYVVIGEKLVQSLAALQSFI